MKKATFLIIVVLLVVAAGAVTAQDLFVTARVAMLVTEPSTSAGRAGIVRQGDALELLSENGEWYEVVTATGQSGFIQAEFVGSEPGASRVASGGLENISSVTTRRRASAYSTSAAATRGLSEDNPRERQNMSFDAYDFRAVSWVKRFSYSDDELINFAQAEGIGL